MSTFRLNKCMQKNLILLEDAYHIVKVRQYLLSEGYSQEQIDLLIEKGMWDKVKRGAAIGTAALSMMGGHAKGDDISDIKNSVDSLRRDAPQLIQGVMNNASNKYMAGAKTVGELITNTMNKEFKGNIPDESITAIKTVVLRVFENNPKHADKIVQVIKDTAKQLNGDAKSYTSVYSISSSLAERLK